MNEMIDACCTPNTRNHNGCKYDLAVLGAGSAGFSAAITAAELGAQVALIGHGTIGGTCVNVGCVPSKALIRASEAIHHANTASRFAGIDASAKLSNWNELRKQKDELVLQLRKAKYTDLLPAYYNVAYIDGKASFEEGRIKINGQFIQAEKTIIATGSREFIPNIPGIDQVEYLTSTTVFELQDLPSSMIIVGGGYVGCELAQMLARAGVQVTLVFRSRLIPDGEPEISTALSGYFSLEGINVIQVEKYAEIQKITGKINLSVSIDNAPKVLVADQIVLATGRLPNSNGLGLETLGVKLDHTGGIQVDKKMRTNKTSIYAAGDVTGKDQFVYMAAYGAKIAAKNAMNGDSLTYDNAAMPAVVFTDPQVASVGLTEADALSQGYGVKTSVLSLDNVPRALAARDMRGLIKLVAEESTGRLVGAHILAPEGADSIQCATLAIKQGMTYSELGEMIFPYLTTVEALKLAAQAFDRDVSKLSCCAG